MPLTLDALDKFVSQKLSQFTTVDFSDIIIKYEIPRAWLSKFILNSIFGNPLSNKTKQFVFIFIRRSEMAF